MQISGLILTLFPRGFKKPQITGLEWDDLKDLEKGLSIDLKRDYFDILVGISDKGSKGYYIIVL